MTAIHAAASASAGNHNRPDGFILFFLCRFRRALNGDVPARFFSPGELYVPRPDQSIAT
jgi:hypothetical protein